MVNIMMEADDIWDMYQDTPEAVMGVMHEVANNTDYGVVIYFTANKEEAKFIVEVDDEEEYEEYIINNVDCKKTFERICNDYLTSEVVNTLGLDYAVNTDGKDDEEDVDDDDIIDMREDELDVLVEDFLRGVTDGAYFDSGNSEVIEDLKEHFLEYMARKHSIPVFRPMKLEDVDTGEEFYEEYPYECMEFEDEDNPLYK